MIFIKITNPLFTLLCLYKLIIHRRRLYGSSYKTAAFLSSLFYPFTILMHEDSILLHSFKIFYFYFFADIKTLYMSLCNPKRIAVFLLSAPNSKNIGLNPPLCHEKLLSTPHSRIFAAQSQKLLMGSGLRYFSTGHHENLISIFYNRQCMSNHHNSFVFLQKI